MHERGKLVELWKRGDAAALVTLVRVEGSSYRRPGARLLIARNGEYAGAISGGCLEAEVIRKAAWKVRDGAVVERYSTLFDDTAEIPYGLGCGGTVDLLLEPAGTPEFTALMEAFEASLRGEARRIRTQLPLPGCDFARSIFDADGASLFHTRVHPSSIEDGLFEETLQPPQRLVVVGAGDDAQPLVTLANGFGWRVVVADGRPQWAQVERFPEAERVVVCDGARASELGMQADDVIVLMTHSYEQDRAWLREALPLRPRYLGLLGARHRSALLLAESAAMLGWTLEQACEGVFAPMGLDLGGDGADSIALATMAEIQARLQGKLATTRRMTPEVIEQQIARGGASRYPQTQCAL